jgi:hypothetical protein
VNATGGSDDGFYNFNFGHLNDEGFTPGNKLNRTLSVQVDELNFQTISLSVVRTTLEQISQPPVARSGGSGVEEQVYLFC